MQPSDWAEAYHERGQDSDQSTHRHCCQDSVLGSYDSSDQRAEGDGTVAKGPHRRVHPPLELVSNKNLAEAHLIDVVDWNSDVCYQPNRS
jgi:hypothetical protein